MKMTITDIVRHITGKTYTVNRQQQITVSRQRKKLEHT
jgi:hypothetical protein